MISVTPPPPPKGWAIVPADDPRLDCLPAKPMFYTEEKGWKLSGFQKEEVVIPYLKNEVVFALPIQASPAPAQPETNDKPSQPETKQPLAKVRTTETGPWLTIFNPEEVRDMTLVGVVWTRDYTPEEYTAIASCCQPGTPMRLEGYADTTPAMPDQPAASADPKGQAGAAKPPLGLIPPEAMRQAAIVHALGAKKYKAWNWRETKVLASTYVNAALRHIAEYQDRLDVEPESGQSPLAHAIASLNILLDAKKAGTLIDDRSPAPLVMDAQCPD